MAPGTGPAQRGPGKRKRKSPKSRKRRVKNDVDPRIACNVLEGHRRDVRRLADRRCGTTAVHTQVVVDWRVRDGTGFDDRGAMVGGKDRLDLATPAGCWH